jgi:hypothetical protein
MVKITLDFAELCFYNEKVVQITIFPSSDISLDDSKLLLEQWKKLTNNKPFPTLFLVGEFVSIDTDARNFSASEEGMSNSIAEAYVLNNQGHVLMSRIYLKVNKPIKPTRFFTNKAAAIEWLETF